MPKSDKTLKISKERRLRINLVINRLGALVPPHVIAEEISAAWKITHKEADSLISDAYATMARQAAGVNAEERRAELRIAAKMAHLVAVEERDVPNQLKAIELLSKLDGLQKTQVEVGMANGTAVAIGAGLGLGLMGLQGPEAVRARIEELKQKLFPPVSKPALEAKTEEVTDVEIEEEGDPPDASE